MAGSSVQIEWTSKDEAIVRTLQKTEKGLDNLARKMDQVQKSSKAAADTTTKEFDKAASTLKGFAMGVVGVGGAIQGVQFAARMLKQEYDILVKRQQSSLDANKSLAEVLPSTYRQFGGLLSAKEIEAAVSKASAATGVGQVNAALAIGEAGAARGATNKQEAQEAIAAATAALKFAPEADPATIAALAGGTTDIQRRFGVSAEESIGFLARVGGQARVTSLREQVQNLNPGIGNLAAYGMAPDAAGGLISVLTGATGDFTGAISATASGRLAKELTDRGFATPEAGIAALQADPKLRDAFLKGGMFGGKKFAKADFEIKAIPAIRELLTGGSALAQNYVAATREVGSFEQGGQTYEDMIREVESLRSVGIAGGNRKLTAGTERFVTSQDRDARIASAREKFMQTIESVDFAGPDLPVRYAARAQFERDVFRGQLDPEFSAAKRLENLASGGRTGQPLVNDEQAAYLREQASILRQMLSTMQEQSGGGAQPPIRGMGR